MGAIEQQSIVLAFFFEDGVDLSMVNIIVNNFLGMKHVFFDVLQPAWVIAVYKDTPDFRINVISLVEQIIAESVTIDNIKSMRLGIQCGKLIISPDQDGVTKTRPLGSPMSEAMQKAKQATEFVPCVGVNELKASPRRAE